jgi:hypothetical protein
MENVFFMVFPPCGNRVSGFLDERDGKEQGSLSSPPENKLERFRKPFEFGFSL